MLKPLRNNEQGIVFVTVLMIIIVMMTLTVSILSMNVTQVMTTQDEIRRIQARVLAMGAIPYMFANQASGSSANYITYTETLGNITFDVSANISGSGLSDSLTNGLNIQVSY